MKKKVFILIFLTILFLNCKGQQETKYCNKGVNYKELEKLLPDNFCMPTGYMAYRVIDTIDLTDDNLFDKIIRWHSPKFQDGDTTFITIFKQNLDSTFTFLITLNNLYAPYFNSYDHADKVSDPKLQKIKSLFGYSNYNQVEFMKNTIKVGFFTDAGGGVDFYFVFDKSRQNWFLQKEVFWTGDGVRFPYQVDGESKPKNEMKILDFNIVKYLQER